MPTRRLLRGGSILTLAFGALFAGGATRIVQDQCGPFTDVAPAFCPFVSELYYLGITAGTSATTFSPDDPLTRGQAAVFIAKGLDQSLARASRRAALGHWWLTTPHWDLGLGVTTVGSRPFSLASDGTDLWVANQSDGTVSRVRASDGKALETWTGATGATDVLVAMGRIFVNGNGTPGVLYMIDPTQVAGAVATVASNLGASSNSLAFDGSRIWSANLGGSVSIVTPASSLPWPVTTVTTGFSDPSAVLWDGTNMWLTEYFGNHLYRLDQSGAILQTINAGYARFPVFDGANIWIPQFSSGVIVIQAATGNVVAELQGNGIDNPVKAAFDGERILVTNADPANSVSVWRATDLAPLGTFPVAAGSDPVGVCSDGINFWVTLRGMSQIARF